MIYTTKRYKQLVLPTQLDIMQEQARKRALAQMAERQKVLEVEKIMLEMAHKTQRQQDQRRESQKQAQIEEALREKRNEVKEQKLRMKEKEARSNRMFLIEAKKRQEQQQAQKKMYYMEKRKQMQDQAQRKLIQAQKKLIQQPQKPSASSQQSQRAKDQILMMKMQMENLKKKQVKSRRQGLQKTLGFASLQLKEEEQRFNYQRQKRVTEDMATIFKIQAQLKEKDKKINKSQLSFPACQEQQVNFEDNDQKQEISLELKPPTFFKSMGGKSVHLQKPAEAQSLILPLIAISRAKRQLDKVQQRAAAMQQLQEVEQLKNQGQRLNLQHRLKQKAFTQWKHYNQQKPEKKYQQLQKSAKTRDQFNELKYCQVEEQRKKKLLLQQIRHQWQLDHQSSTSVEKAEQKEKTVYRQKKLEVPDLLLCPITQATMSSPMILTTCGHTFEEIAIRAWLRRTNKCPLCNKQSSEPNLIKNFALAAICMIHH